ncbi:MAG: TIGR03915 family putative DNA repair protein [Tissierellia bacterium]|nr:TIGR03915 family putative DNA repair protein [Tissierellia bacterium]
MIIRYDGSFEGLLSVIFETWTNFSQVEDIQRPGPKTLFEETWVDTKEENANRVYHWLKKTDPLFLKDKFRYGYLSEKERMDYLNVYHLHLLYQKGREILLNPSGKTQEYLKNIRTVKRELHRFTGLTRFEEVQSGALYAAIRPEGNILLPLGGHFMKRLPHEEFLIHDHSRDIGVYHKEGNLELVAFSLEDLQYSDKEKVMSELWRTFTKAISIEERKSKKRQMSNMPKKYWEFLTEMQ